MADILSTDDSQFRNVTTQVPSMFAPGLVGGGGMPNLQLGALGQYFSDLAKYKAQVAREQQMWQRKMAEREMGLKERLAEPPPRPVEQNNPIQVQTGEDYVPIYSTLNTGGPGYMSYGGTYGPSSVVGGPGKVATGYVPAQLSSLYAPPKQSVLGAGGGGKQMEEEEENPMAPFDPYGPGNQPGTSFGADPSKRLF